MTCFGIRPVTAVAAVLAAVVFTVFALAPRTSGAPVASAQTPPNYSTYPHGASSYSPDSSSYSPYGYSGYSYLYALGFWLCLPAQLG